MPVRLPARRERFLGGYVASIAIAYALDLSFAIPVLNLLAVLAALCASAWLVLTLFGLKPWWLGIPLGLLGIGGWLTGLLFIVVVSAFDGNSPKDMALGGGLLCRQTVYGFVGSDSGTELALYRRLLLVDQRIHYERLSDIYPGVPAAVPAGLRDAVARCRQAANGSNGVLP